MLGAYPYADNNNQCRNLGTVEVLGTNRFDPLLHDVELPLSGVFYPIGFRLDVATNSPHVLAAAAESWGHYTPEFTCEPLRFRVLVQPEGPLAQPPAHRSQAHLYSAVSDADNFATADLRSLHAFFVISETTAADHVWLRWFFVESMAYLLLAQRYVVPIHTACVARNGSGVLLCGPSGAGKSTLSFSCARAGWTFVSDDCTFLLMDSAERLAIGKPHQVRLREDAGAFFPELEDYIARLGPNGKVSFEVPVRSLSQIQTSLRCPVDRIVVLQRSPQEPARLEPIASREATETLLRDLPSYGDEVNLRHERTIRNLLDVPAYRLRYQSLDDAIRLLGAGLGAE